MKALVIFFISFFLSATQSDSDQMDKINKSLLQAVRDRNIGKATELLKLGANVNYQDEQLDSPFLLSGALGYTEFVQLFLDNGARFDVFNRYNGTALIPACERGHIETVRLLANTIPDKNGVTALEHARNSGYKEIVRILER